VGEVTVSLLGGFAAEVGGVPVAAERWRLRKARDLVKLLALAPGHRRHREQVMDVLWRDHSPSAALNNLHQAVHVARRALVQEAIVVRDEVLFLVADVDVDRFELAAGVARRSRTPASYRSALSLYGGELLPENRYDDWALERREELAGLATELAAELEALGSSVDQELPRLPHDASSFVGRERELAELEALLPRTRLLTLAGTGGTGKTRLALELARRSGSQYAGGAALVELAAVVDGARVADAVALALDVRALPGQEPVAALVDYLAARSVLLVVDNCEHLIAASAAVADSLLRAAAQLTILATSREPLRVPGEVVFRVPSLDIPDPEQSLEPDELLAYEAVRLFAERAAAAAPGFGIDTENAGDVARVCFRLDGLPLALELAAGRLSAFGVAEIADRLDDRFRVLRGGSRTSPTRQQTLEATLDWSHDLLDPEERMLFRRLAVFAGGFVLASVEGVCTGIDIALRDVADLLARLVEKSLVAPEESFSGHRRYRLLETMRLYARERLHEAGETAAVAESHARWAVELAEVERGSPRLDAEAANLRAALDLLLAEAPREALRLCVALRPFWMRRIDLQEAQRRFEQALIGAPERTALRAETLLAAAAIDLRAGTVARGLARAEESRAIAAELGDRRTEWRALQALGEFAVATDEANLALPWLERALALAQREGLAAEEAIGVYSLGVAHWIRGELARAAELLERSVELFGPLVGSGERIPSPVNIADLRTTQPHGTSALRVVFEDSLQPFTEISPDDAVGYVLANQAVVARARGDLARARALLDESAARFERSGDETGRAALLVRRAYLELAEGAPTAARAALEEALALRGKQSDRRGIGLVLGGLGQVDISVGDYASAERHLAEAREMFTRAGDRWGLASTLWRTADLAFAQGKLDDAEASLEEARAVLLATQRERWIANTLAGLAEVALARGETERAAELLCEARDRYAARDDAVGVADVEERLRSFTV
jgi:predicted ATPase